MTMISAFGLLIVTRYVIPETVQRIKLRESVGVSLEFRESFNSWLRKRFGEERVVLTDGRHIFMHATTLTVLKNSSYFTSPPYV